jgi:uncharacterized membrane protein YfcA
MSVQMLLLLILGITAGTLSGFIGIGGGIIVIPALVLFFGFSQHLAQGTTLALMVPPIGLFAAWIYYKAGYVDLKAAAIICLGFIIGSLFSAKFAVEIPDTVIRKAFGVILLFLSLKMLFTK